jgi:hypothetical protein
MVLKIQNHVDLARSLDSSKSVPFVIKLKKETPLFRRADRSSELLQNLSVGEVLRVTEIVPGLVNSTMFMHVLPAIAGGMRIQLGYIEHEDGSYELVDE